MELIMTTTLQSVALPVPNARISVRLGTRGDIPFIDALQKQYGKALGFFPRAQLEGYIDNGWMLIAEMDGSPAGFCASRDRYLKRDELGVIYQLCVSPSAQRGLIGASLIKAVFERSAYGCRLYCCWCAQDLAANRFWEALGFVPIAFRGGSAKKSRIHIFWQKRIRTDDVTTPWWFPAKTDGGAIREDRIVLPIPPGLHWSDAMPVTVAERPGATGCTQPVLADGRAKTHGLRTTRGTQKKPRPSASQFGPPGAAPIVEAEPVAALAIVGKPTVRAPARIKTKVDPKLIAAARELRDRYLEQVNTSSIPVLVGKYDVSRTIEATTSKRTKRLAA